MLFMQRTSPVASSAKSLGLLVAAAHVLWNFSQQLLIRRRSKPLQAACEAKKPRVKPSIKKVQLHIEQFSKALIRFRPSVLILAAPAF
jgi:hypothetical protein